MQNSRNFSVYWRYGEEQSVYIMYVYYRIGFHSIKLRIEEFRSLSKTQVKFMHEKLEREMNIFNFMHILLWWKCYLMYIILDANLKWRISFLINIVPNAHPTLLEANRTIFYLIHILLNKTCFGKRISEGNSQYIIIKKKSINKYWNVVIFSYDYYDDYFIRFIIINWDFIQW